MISEGTAFLDRSGRVLVADETFRALLDLPSGDVSRAFERRAEHDATLARLVAADGPDSVRLAASNTTPECELSRVASSEGMLLRARTTASLLRSPPLELAMQAVVLAKLAGSVAHEVKNPLNAMALQVALIGDKIGAADDALASACAGNLASLKNQIGRINEVVRRYLEIADPPPSSGFDAGSLVADAANLFGHEARRRRIALACEAVPGAIRAAGDATRAARLLLGLLWRALADTPPAGRLLARAMPSGAEVVLAVEHAQGTADPDLAWVGPVVAAGMKEMGGRLEESSRDGIVRAALVLPKESVL